jgi:hypothetical protein
LVVTDELNATVVALPVLVEPVVSCVIPPPAAPAFRVISPVVAFTAETAVPFNVIFPERTTGAFVPTTAATLSTPPPPPPPSATEIQEFWRPAEDIFLYKKPTKKIN